MCMEDTTQVHLVSMLQACMHSFLCVWCESVCVFASAHKLHVSLYYVGG